MQNKMVGREEDPGTFQSRANFIELGKKKKKKKTIEGKSRRAERERLLRGSGFPEGGHWERKEMGPPTGENVPKCQCPLFTVGSRTVVQ